MKWEDQEINVATPAGNMREVIRASFRIRSLAERKAGEYLRITQELLDQDAKEAERALIHRLCLYERALCRISPGGGAYTDFGVSHYWSDSKSLYAIFQIAPNNDWLEIMVLHATHPAEQKQKWA